MIVTIESGLAWFLDLPPQKSYALLIATGIAALLAMQRVSRGGWLKFKAPTLWLLGALFLFVSAGVTSIQLNQFGADRAYHDTHYVVAHSHYMLSLCTIFILFAAIYRWFPRLSHRTYPEWAARLHFAMLFIGVNLTYLPQLVLSRQGMPRRYIDYPNVYSLWHDLATLGVSLSLFSLCFFIVITLYILIRTNRIS